MFVDDTTFFYLGKDFHLLFNTINNEFPNISHLFNSNKSFINADKTKFALFHKPRQCNNIPLVLTTSKINNTLVKRVDLIKCLGYLFDKNVTWKNHIKYY